MAKEINNKTPRRQQVRDIEKGERRASVSGYPRLTKFTSPQEVYEYLGQDEIDCLLCGRRFGSLAAHLSRIHRMTSDDYRERYGLPYRKGLTSKGFTESLRATQLAAPKALKEVRARNFQKAREMLHASGPARTSQLKRMTAKQSFRIASSADRSTDRVEIEAVVAAVEGGQLLRVAVLASPVSFTAFRAGLKRHPDLEARYAAVAGKARRERMMGNTLAHGPPTPP